jgi:flagellar basal-body rod modification protein FlgD
MSISSIGSSAGSESATPTVTNNQTLGQQDFLNIMMAEMTNQDPMSPQDDTQFLAELAQFSTVNGVNTITQDMGQIQATSLLGKTVTAMSMVNGVNTPINGVVQAVSYTNTGVNITVNNQDIPLSDVQSVQ